MRPLSTGTIICLSFLVSCTKESNQKHCWQIVDNLGNNLTQICDKTEAQLIACAKNGTCNIAPGTDLKPCSYYMSDTKQYCWLINNRYYYNKMTEDEVNKLMQCHFPGGTASKADCNSNCQNWYSRKKSTSLQTEMFTYSPVTFRTWCGDSADIINSNRKIILKSDFDSLIIIQFSIDGIYWQ